MSNFSSEMASIEAVVNKYFDGVVNANPEMISEAFEIEQGHLKAVGVDKNGNEFVKVEPFSDARSRWGAGNPVEVSGGNVESIDIIDGKMAVVKFDLKLGQLRFLDLLTLYKLNNQWKVVNKTFVTR